jgi:hypothetical protein
MRRGISPRSSCVGHRAASLEFMPKRYSEAVRVPHAAPLRPRKWRMRQGVIASDQGFGSIFNLTAGKTGHQKKEFI